MGHAVDGTCRRRTGERPADAVACYVRKSEMYGQNSDRELECMPMNVRMSVVSTCFQRCQLAGPRGTVGQDKPINMLCP